MRKITYIHTEKEGCLIPEKEMEEDDTEERNVVIRGNYCKKCHFITS
jgi:hypothetical protein